MRCSSLVALFILATITGSRALLSPISSRVHAARQPAQRQQAQYRPAAESDASSSGMSRRAILREVLKAMAVAVGATAGDLGLGGITAAYAAGGGADSLVKNRFGEKLRRAAAILDELQADLFNEDYDLVATYPAAFRTLIPIFTKYTDAAFPSNDPIDSNARVALRYEVGRFFGAVERLKRATDVRDLKEMESAYAAMSVAYDRYLKAGNLYVAYDPITSTEKFYADIDDKNLVFISPNRDPPKIKDDVILIRGPDKGKAARVIGAEGGERLILKLQTKGSLGGISEIKVVPLGYAAKIVA